MTVSRGIKTGKKRSQMLTGQDQSDLSRSSITTKMTKKQEKGPTASLTEPNGSSYLLPLVYQGGGNTGSSGS